MAITEKSIKLLWANAAGRCSFTGCEERLTIQQASEAAPFTLGEMAHNKGRKKGSNRYDQTQSDKERDDYKNLILMCPTHHTLIDKPENEKKYSVELLTEMKMAHEANILSRLNTENSVDVEALKDNLQVHLSENHQSWLQYGPTSENARKNPNSKELHSLWLSERLSTIVPNNRKMIMLLKEHRLLFGRNSQSMISEFFAHVDSYEKWVNNEIPYQAVLRLPLAFQELVES